MQDLPFPNLGMVRNMKPAYVSRYCIPGMACGLRHVNAQTRRSLVMYLCLIRDTRKCHVLNNIIYTKCKPKQKVNFQIKKTFGYFIVRESIDKGQPDNMKKKTFTSNM